MDLFFVLFCIGVCGSVLIWLVVVDADACLAVVTGFFVVAWLVTRLTLSSEADPFLMSELDNSVHFPLVNPVVLYPCIDKIFVDYCEDLSYSVV